MNSLYLPRHVLRQEAPWGGDAESRWDNKHSMPFAIAAGVTAGAAMAAGAAVTVAGVVSVVAGAAVAAGLAMTVVGMATGDKSLMKIGMITGLAGGVASLGVSALSAGTDIALSSTSEAALAAAPTEASLAAAPAESTMAAAQAAEQAGTSGLAQSAGGFIPDVATKALPMGSSSLSTPVESTLSASYTPTANSVSTGLSTAAPESTGANSYIASMKDFVKDAGSSVGNSTTTIGKDTGTIVDKAMNVGKDLAGGTSVKDLIMPASQIIGAIGQSNSTDAYIKAQQQTANNQLAFDKAKYNQQLASANSIGRLNLSTAPWTPNNGQLTPAQIAAHVSLDANGNPIQPKTGILA